MRRGKLAQPFPGYSTFNSEPWALTEPHSEAGSGGQGIGEDPKDKLILSPGDGGTGWPSWNSAAGLALVDPIRGRGGGACADQLGYHQILQGWLIPKSTASVNRWEAWRGPNLRIHSSVQGLRDTVPQQDNRKESW